MGGIHWNTSKHEQRTSSEASFAFHSTNLYFLIFKALYFVPESLFILPCRSERALINIIVGCVWSKVHPTFTIQDPTELVGIDSIVEQVDLLLAPEVDDVLFTGIWGMGGIGKTTLANLFL